MCVFWVVGALARVTLSSRHDRKRGLILLAACFTRHMSRYRADIMYTLDCHASIYRTIYTTVYPYDSRLCTVDPASHLLGATPDMM